MFILFNISQDMTCTNKHSLTFIIIWFLFLIFGIIPSIDTMETIGTEEANLNDPNDSNADIDISNLTLEQFCQQYNISSSICTCQFLGEICILLNKSKSSQDVVVVHLDTCNELSLTVMILVSSTIGIFGNILVIVVTYFNWRTSSWCHKLIGGLALCDFIFVVLDLAQTVPYIWTCEAIYGEIMCKLFAFAINAVSTMGLGFILIVAVERYIGICFPFTRGLSSKAINVMIIVNFGFSLSTNVPLMVVTEKSELLKCSEKWSNDTYPRIYSWLMLLFSFLLPVIGISLMYSKIIYIIWKAKRDISSSIIEKTKRNKEQQRIMFILVSVLVAFVLLVSPDKLIWALKDQGLLKKVSRQVEQLLNLCTRIPLSLHAAINPIIYSVVDRRFRDSLRLVLFK